MPPIDTYSHTVDTDDGYKWVIHTDGSDYWVDHLIFTEEDGTELKLSGTLTGTTTTLLAVPPYPYPLSALPHRMLFPPNTDESGTWNGGPHYVD